MLINKHNLAVAEFAAEKSRYSNGTEAMLVSEQGTCATNGHYLVRVTLPNDDDDEKFPEVPGFVPAKTVKSWLMPVETARMLKKALLTSKKACMPNACIGNVTEDTVSIVAAADQSNFQAFQVHPAEGKFPNVDNAIPKENPVLEIRLNAGYLAKLAKAAEEFIKGTERRDVTLRFYGPNNVVEMKAKNEETGQEWYALLMTMF